MRDEFFQLLPVAVLFFQSLYTKRGQPGQLMHHKRRMACFYLLFFFLQPEHTRHTQWGEKGARKIKKKNYYFDFLNSIEPCGFFTSCTSASFFLPIFFFENKKKKEFEKFTVGKAQLATTKKKQKKKSFFF